MKHAGFIEIEANGTGKAHRMDPSFKRTKEGRRVYEPTTERKEC